MREVTRESLRRMLAETGTKQADLARFMGLTEDKISKILRGVRGIQAREAAQISEFFARKRGFSESGQQPRLDMSDIPPLGASPENTADDELNKIKLAVVGDRVQIAGTYDRKGLDRLIERLEKVKDLMD